RHASLFAVLLAALAVSIRRHTGRERFAIGTITANRESLMAEREVGFFANTVPVIATPGSELPFAGLVSQVAVNWREVMARATVSFESITTLAEAEHEPSRAPLLDLVFILQDEPPALDLDGCQCVPLRSHNGTAKFDLTLEAGPEADALRLRWEYCAETVSRATVERLATSLLRIVERVTADPGVLVADLIAPDQAERTLLSSLDRRGSHPAGSDSLSALFQQAVD